MIVIDSLTPWDLALATSAWLVGMALCVLFLFRETRRWLVLQRRLQPVRAQVVSARGEAGRRSEETAPTWSYLYLAAAGAMRVAAILVPVSASERAKIGGLIRQAGFRQHDALAIFLSAKMVLTLTAGVLAAVAAAQSYGHPVAIGFAGLAGAVGGGVLPEMALRRLCVRRRNRLSRALPDALDLMVLCVDTGFTFERALAMVSEELGPLSPDLAMELQAVVAELSLGADRRTAMQNLYVRTGAEGLRDFAMTVVQGERYGTPLGQSIQNIARNERAQRAARIEAQAGRLPVLMSLPMLLLVVPGILLLMGGPAFMMALEALKGIGSP